MTSDIAPELSQLAAAPAIAPRSNATAAAQAPVQSDGTWKRAAVICGIVGVIALVLWAAGQGSHAPQSTAQNTGWQPDTATAAADSAQNAAATASEAAAAASASAEPVASAPEVAAQIQEDKPPPGSNLQLTANQIAYCRAEKVRMQAAQSVLNNGPYGAVADFNQRVEDYNSRCGEFRYLQADLTAADSYVSAHQADLEAAGRSRVVEAPAVDGGGTPPDPTTSTGSPDE